MLPWFFFAHGEVHFFRVMNGISNGICWDLLMNPLHIPLLIPVTHYSDTSGIIICTNGMMG